MAGGYDTETDYRTIAPVYGADDSSGTFEGILEQVPIIGNFLSSAREEKARLAAYKRQQKAFDQLAGLKYGDLGSVSSADWMGVEADPEGLAAQRAGLERLMAIADQKGLTMEDRANLGRIQQDIEQQARGRQEATMQQAAARGNLGSGSFLAQSLMNDQNAANQGAQQGLDVAGMGERRALQALMAGQQAGAQLAQQGFNQGAQKAAALNQIAQFNKQLQNLDWQNRLGYEKDKYNAYMDLNNAATGGARQASQWASANRQVIPQVVKSVFTMGATAGSENAGGPAGTGQGGGGGIMDFAGMFGGFGGGGSSGGASRPGTSFDAGDGMRGMDPGEPEYLPGGYKNPNY